MNIIREIHVDGFVISTDRTRLDRRFVHSFLTAQSYWAQHIPFHVVEMSIENSLSIGIYKAGAQIGFARIVTDFATFGYLADVFVDPQYRGLGLSKKLMEFISTLDFVPKLRRFILGTRDAHGLYQKFGFVPILHPDRFMEIHQPEIYSTMSDQ